MTRTNTPTLKETKMIHTLMPLMGASVIALHFALASLAAVVVLAMVLGQLVQ